MYIGMLNGLLEFENSPESADQSRWIQLCFDIKKEIIFLRQGEMIEF